MPDAPPPFPPESPTSNTPFVSGSAGSTQVAGEAVDEGKGRIFPCDNCGADLVFHIGQQSLKCPYCGSLKKLEPPPEESIAEQDFQAMLARLVELREQKDAAKGDGEAQTSEVRCEACGGTVVFLGTLTSSECPYCSTPIQRDKIHGSPERVPVDGVLPFLVDREKAAENLKAWVRSRWFAPNKFLKRGVTGKFNGVYMPYWTYDAMTSNRYTGQRGEHYYVTVGTGKEQRRERRTRWYPASGSFQQFFDDVMSFAATGLPRWLTIALEPWPLSKCVPFDQRYLAGFLARTYDIELDQGFEDAKQRMEEAIRESVRRRIGGDEQRILSLNTRYSALTYKHLLLPVWLMAYRYHDKTYQVAVNAGTGEVQGERPYSWVKITLAVIAALIAVGIIAYIQQG